MDSTCRKYGNSHFHILMCYLRSSRKPFFNWDTVACIVSMRGAHKNACEKMDMRMGWNEQICGLIPRWIHTISHWGGGFHRKGYLGRQLSPKKGGIERGKVILLSFDKTMELLMCIKEMKGRLKVAFCSFNHLGKMSWNGTCEIFKCHVIWFETYFNSSGLQYTWRDD